jgi:hypothetical protein
LGVFDIVGAHGTTNDSIKVELATRVLIPKANGSPTQNSSPPDGSDAPHRGQRSAQSLDAALKMRDTARPMAAICCAEAELSALGSSKTAALG